MTETAVDQVSILIPAYNAAETLSATLSSVARQHYRPLQVVIVNDGSTDGTQALAEAWAHNVVKSDFQVSIISQPNAGLLHSRNVGVERSTGQFLQFLDADDILHPAKLSRSVVGLETTNADVTVSRTRKFFDDAEIRDDLATGPTILPWTSGDLNGSTITSNYWHSVGPLFRRSVLETVGPFPEDIHPVAEELEFHGRVKLSTVSVHYLDEVLNFYRKGRRASVTGDLQRLYEGRIAGSRVARDLLQRHEVTSSKEWNSLVRMATQTYYAATNCLAENVDLRHQARREWLTCLHASRSSMTQLAHLLPAGLIETIWRTAYRVRNRDNLAS